MKARALLTDCDFGYDVADNDLRLSQYFVETSSFNDVVQDRADLILGEKGSGKSAIFRHLAHSAEKIPKLQNTIILPAFNTQGSAVLQRLSEYNSLPEDAFRLAWFTYLVALAGNHIIDATPRKGRIKELAKLLQNSDLRVSGASPAGVWTKIDRLLERISKRFEVEGEVRLSPTRVPLSLGLKGKLLRRTKGAEVDLEQILVACTEQLAERGQRCWIIFDRLDEAFQHDPALESVALRGLLRAHLDLTSYQSALRSKLFLRTDILDRVTASSGFVNATHLRRQYLKWDRDSITALIARRIMAEPAVAETLRLTDEKLKSRRGRLDICSTVFPRRIDHQDLPGWLEQCTTDGRGAMNPRNVITLLGNARACQLEVYDRDDPYYLSGWPLIRSDSLQRALRQLSESRLEDTVIAEHAYLRPALDAIRGKPARMSKENLQAALGSPGNVFERQVSQLLYAGVLSAGASGRYMTVPELYRHALSSTVQRHPEDRELTSEETEDLRQTTENVCRAAIESGSAQVIQEIDEVQRKVVVKYIRGNYPSLKISTLRARSTGFRVLQVRSADSAPPARSDDSHKPDFLSSEDLYRLYQQLCNLFRDVAGSRSPTV